MASFKDLPLTFHWLNISQFGGSLNDNILKLLIIFFIIGSQGHHNASTVVALIGALFVIPFLIFSAAAGTLADRHSKRNIIVIFKFTEIIVVLISCISFYFHWLQGLYLSLFLMATQSAFFGPSKYGIVPEIINKHYISYANGLMTSFTYLSIILGTSMAPFITQLSGYNYLASSIFCLMIAIIGFIASLFIHKTKPLGSAKPITPFFLRDIFHTIQSIKHEKTLMLAVFGSAYFLMIGAFMQLNMIPYGIKYLNLDQVQSGYLFLVAALGIGFGGWLAGVLSGRHIEFGLVPLGAFGLSLGSFSLKFIPPSHYFAGIFILMIGISAGLYIVPIQSFIQYKSPKKNRGEVIAASGFLSWVGVLIASVMLFIFDRFLHLSPQTGFAIIGCLTFLITLYILYILPDFLVRFLIVLLTKTFYRIKTIGINHVPVDKPALLISNHVSWVDALLINATSNRRIRFIMDLAMYENPWLKPLYKLMGVIPIDKNSKPKSTLFALKKAQKALDQGSLVCIFAEGSLTRTGHMYDFKAGFEHIVKNTHYPIIPVYLGGVWGSIFSYAHGKLLSTWPKKIPYPITIVFGSPLGSKTKAFKVRQSIQELSTIYYNSLKSSRTTLPNLLIHTLRKRSKRPCLADSLGKKLNASQTLIASLLLKNLLKNQTTKNPYVGILLPSTVGGALCNTAVVLLGKIPVNINFTLNKDALNCICKECQFDIILTSKQFIDKFPELKFLDHLIYLEDLLTSVKLSQKILALIQAKWFPRHLLIPKKINADDIATIIFSSGSTGTPKGVMLSHYNIISNIDACSQIFRISEKDNVCGILPFFHSFGFTITLWFPLLNGFSATYHPNPLEAKSISDLVKKHQSTLLFATPTFLQSYIRKANPEDFKTLRYVITGAEKLKSSVASAFENKFNIRPLEGYGTTELSPVVSINIPNITINTLTQIGAKEGTVGHPIPGCATKIVNPDTWDELNANQEGLLLIKGPNQMRGYLNQPKNTQNALHNEWYITGDIAKIDQQGFITITDRMSRFSKIAGEMVPHIAIEDYLLEKLNTHESIICITSIPDEKKGEKLVLFFTPQAGSKENIVQLIDQCPLPNLFKPHQDAIIEIDEIPILGSGKTNLAMIKKLATEYFAPNK